MACPTVDMSCNWNSLTAERTRVLVRSGLNLAKTRNISSASFVRQEEDQDIEEEEEKLV